MTLGGNKDVVGEGCVLYDWVQNMSWKEQSALFSSFRGPDNYGMTKVKLVTKWLRSISQKNADPSTTFMKVDIDQLPDKVEFCEELQFTPVHFLDHIMTGLSLVAAYHDNDIFSNKAREYVSAMYEEHLHVMGRLKMAGKKNAIKVINY